MGNKRSDFACLPLDDFLKELKETYNDYAHPIQQRRAEDLTLEHSISELVYQAYGLTPEEIDLMWKTAPPRMPFQRP